MRPSADRIVEMSRTVYAWCVMRTANASDAEDLSQEIMLAMVQSLPDLRNEQAFYGFMWSIARHVYQTWLRKKRNSLTFSTAYENIAAENPFEGMEITEEINLLRRELTLLSQHYRQAAVLHYVRGMKVAQIAKAMSISESMVKYLLFKARNILREGMEMERSYGEQSYRPRKLNLQYWGGPSHRYGMADTILRQNIFFACYNDALTADQIALAIGVGLPYMEDDLRQLLEADLLLQDGAGRYRANIVLFTQDYMREAKQLVTPEIKKIAAIVRQFVTEQENAVRMLDFVGSSMNRAAYVWQMTAMLLHLAVIDIAGKQAAPKLPPDPWGAPSVCWGIEAGDTPDGFNFGVCFMENLRHDRVQFMDFPINGDMVHFHLNKQSVANVFLALARNKKPVLSENDEAIVSELVRKGYVTRVGNGYAVHCPIFSQRQFNELTKYMLNTARQIAEISLIIRGKESRLLQEHVPKHLEKTANEMAYFRLFEDAISSPVSLLYAERFLPDAALADVLPTTYVTLHD